MSSANGRSGIVSLGGINMDLVTFSPRLPLDGETVVGDRFVTYSGGKGANQAVAAARAGGRSTMVGRVGGDVFGPQLIELLQSAGVQTDCVGVTEGSSSGIAVISVGEGGQNRIVQVLGANDTCGEAEYEAILNLLPETAVLMLQLEVSVELSMRVAGRVTEQGVKVVLDPGPVRDIPEAFFGSISIITPNETEAEALVGHPIRDIASAQIAADALMARGAGAAVIKMGAHGAYWAGGGSRGHIPPFQVVAVDTVAAGDAFNGAMAVALAEGHPLDVAARWGAAAGALAVTRVGAQDAMPTREAVLAMLESKTA